MEAHGALRQAGIQRAVAGQGQCRGVRHMGVQHAGLAAQAVDGRVDEHGGRLHRVAPSQLAAQGVDHHDVVHANLTPQQAARVQQSGQDWSGSSTLKWLQTPSARPWWAAARRARARSARGRRTVGDSKSSACIAAANPGREKRGWVWPNPTGQAGRPCSPLSTGSSWSALTQTAPAGYYLRRQLYLQ